MWIVTGIVLRACRYNSAVGVGTCGRTRFIQHAPQHCAVRMHRNSECAIDAHVLWNDRVRQRLIIVGYAANRSAVEAVAREALADFAFYDDGPDLSELNHAVDTDRIHIAQEVKEWVEELDWLQGEGEPTKEDIALEALRAIWESG